MNHFVLHSRGLHEEIRATVKGEYKRLVKVGKAASGADATTAYDWPDQAILHEWIRVGRSPSAESRMLRAIACVLLVRNPSAHCEDDDANAERETSEAFEYLNRSIRGDLWAFAADILGFAAWLATRSFKVRRNETTSRFVHIALPDVSDIAPTVGTPRGAPRPPIGAPNRRAGVARWSTWLAAGASLVSIAAVVLSLRYDGGGVAPSPEDGHHGETGSAVYDGEHAGAGAKALLPAESREQAAPAPVLDVSAELATASLPTLRDLLGASYDRQCEAGRKVQEEHEGLGYQERLFVVEMSEGSPLPYGWDRHVTDEALALQLQESRRREVLVLAEAGLGKSWRADALYALLCPRPALVTFLVDLSSLRSPSDSPDDWERLFAREFAASAGTPGPLATRTLNEHIDALRRSAWVALPDGLDEMDAKARDGLAEVLEPLLKKRWPQGRVVLLGRPPVFDRKNHGLDADLVLRIPPLNCAEVDVRIGSWEKRGKIKESGFRVFLRRHGLNERVIAEGDCQYRFIPTYRHLNVLYELAFNDERGDRELAVASQSDILRKFAAALLQKCFPKKAARGAPDPGHLFRQ